MSEEQAQPEQQAPEAAVSEAPAQNTPAPEAAEPTAREKFLETFHKICGAVDELEAKIAFGDTLEDSSYEELTLQAINVSGHIAQMSDRLSK